MKLDGKKKNLTLLKNLHFYFMKIKITQTCSNSQRNIDCLQFSITNHLLLDVFITNIFLVPFDIVHFKFIQVPKINICLKQRMISQNLATFPEFS